MILKMIELSPLSLKLFFSSTVSKKEYLKENAGREHGEKKGERERDKIANLGVKIFSIFLYVNKR